MHGQHVVEFEENVASRGRPGEGKARAYVPADLEVRARTRDGAPGARELDITRSPRFLLRLGDIYSKKTDGHGADVGRLDTLVTAVDTVDVMQPEHDRLELLERTPSPGPASCAPRARAAVEVACAATAVGHV